MSDFTLTQSNYTSLTRKFLQLIIVNIVISVPDNKPVQKVLILVSIRATCQLISNKLTENTFGLPGSTLGVQMAPKCLQINPK